MQQVLQQTQWLIYKAQAVDSGKMLGYCKEPFNFKRH